jgi:hypothetical protein
MNSVTPHTVLALGLSCREPTGVDLIAFLRRAAPFYKSLPGVNVRLHRSVDRPGHFIEIIEYATEEAFHADRARVADDTRMQNLLSEWRALLTEPPHVEHFVDITAEIGGTDG